MNDSLLLKATQARIKQITTIGLAAAISPLSSAATDTGESLYGQHCAGCHAATLRGSAHGAALSGPAFADKWSAASAQSFLAYQMAEMPPGEAQSLSPVQHAAIAQYVISQSDLEADSLLVSSAQTLTSATPDDVEMVEFAEAGSVMDMARSAGAFSMRRVDPFRPVSTEELNQPDAADWLNWRRTPDGHGHSPLTKITRDNVSRLSMSWSMAMHEGSNQPTPLVRDGVMFLTHAHNKIQAIEAATGELIWEYQYTFPPASKMLGGPTRNIALWQDRLFLTTYDAAIVAIDATTGAELWRTEKADYREAFTHSAGPIVANGIVISGINGCELFTQDGCFITGHDPTTGVELWRTATLAEPGTPEYATWGNVAPDRRGGGDIWIAGSYDPELDLVYFGTSQPKPWAAPSRGMSVEDAALYTNATLAMRPKTGELVWHFQHIPGETIDMEVGFERILADIDGEQTLLTVGKDGILWKLNRATGEYLDLLDTMGQTIFSVDRETGRLTYREDIAKANIGDTYTACPGIYGGHNWQSATYDDARHLLFLPVHQLCSDMTPREVDLGPGGGGYGADAATYPMPGKEGLAGALLAIDVRTMEVRWKIEQPALFLSGALSTDGGLLFIGDLDRHFQAFDTQTGARLWSTRLPAPAHGYPVTYEAEGRQFVAIPAGIGVFRALTAVIFPDIYQPPDGQGLFVFSVPQ
ncbi:MAG: alcohol dehydrogenase [Halieaceae bacterium]|nr:MAG: alcohol dehydrogenase [Halieaceae bacterium]